MSQKHKIALVGCGRISKNHLSAIGELKNEYELVAVCDSDESKAKAASKEYDVPYYLSLETLLSESDAEIISICTPSGMHPEHTIAAAKAGKHVVTEKPMAVTWEAGLKMTEACHEAGVRLFVVKQNRKNETLIKLKEALEKGRFGKIYMVNVNVFWTRPQDYYDQASWRGTWALDGGAFMNQASHYIDLLSWLIGPVAEVQSMTGTLARKIEAEDSGVINVRWENGALGSVSVTMLTYPKNLEGSITILGEKGSVKIGGMALNKVETWTFEDTEEVDETIHEHSYETASVYGFGHMKYYKSVSDSLNGQDTDVTSGADGLKSLELLIASYRSAKNKETISLPLESLA